MYEFELFLAIFVHVAFFWWKEVMDRKSLEDLMQVNSLRNRIYESKEVP